MTVKKIFISLYLTNTLRLRQSAAKTLSRNIWVRFRDQEKSVHLSRWKQAETTIK